MKTFLVVAVSLIVGALIGGFLGLGGGAAGGALGELIVGTQSPADWLSIKGVRCHYPSKTTP